ncbi:glycosyltransferase [Leuconostoc gelidum subsp. gelidum]|uniref:Glycosyltransferase n=1 Tax=Leuconostoc gelidum subsp. gelidum TaxID=1607839 RepID=A0AB35FWZ0_LEUGE|nr:glycosyltransferase [Leuconostoc gelidum]MBZ5964049.1 glycosyltransferase [Leuconostoc gelidum subsp. gelidum]MBZ5974210.1 glycosyltransferase [Leuconostoc gelidum subsp. gelidum]MBZ5976081.1 glycosyltransferase [Leuconostoc gelidum subsp. gelidum]MBZ5985931.1 glycosyltransferase [Leuconostoc gelidum subsp. gelidum]MBZ5999914.1 glycosyltransferase [Leuconostoc gelidum subsp. gelidum]
MEILIALENIGLGGMKRATTVVGNALSTRHSVTYYSFSDTEPFYDLEAPLIIGKTPRILDNDAQPFERFDQQIKEFEAVASHFDVVILAGGLLSSFAARLSLPNTKLIGWMHNNVHTYQTQYYAAMRQEFDAGLRALDVIVALTESDLAGFSEYNTTVKIWNPLTITPNGHADLKKHIIAFTARIAIQHKGIDFAVQLASKLPEDWKLAIAGSGLPEDMLVFKQLVATYQATDKIIYRGALKDDDLRAHYQNASLFVQTSRWEGLPLVLVEAMSFGLPVAAMRNTGSAEVLREGDYGILTPNADVEALYTAIEPILLDEKIRQSYSDKSLQRVENFKITPILSQWETLFNQKFDN